MKIAQLIAAHRPTIIQFMKFGTVGGTGFLLDVASLYILTHAFGLTPAASVLISYPFLATLTWLGNRLFTFRGQHTGRAHTQWMRFMAVCTTGMIFNRGTCILLLNNFPFVYRHQWLALMGGTGAAMFFNFFLSRRLVFR